MNSQRLQSNGLPSLDGQELLEDTRGNSPTLLCPDSKFRNVLSLFKEIQKNPHLLLQTLAQMELDRQKQQKREATREAKPLPRYRMEKKENGIIDRKKDSFLCHICGALLRRKTMYGHLKIHRGHRCNVVGCNSFFDSSGNLRKHEINVHGIERKLRKNSGQKSKSKFGRLLWDYKLSVHSQIESVRKSLICKLCGKSFSHKSTLLEHLEIHAGDKWERCSWCSKVYRWKCTLCSHSKICLGRNRN